MGHHTLAVAKITANRAAQRVLLKSPELHSALADNPFLADDVFAELYPDKKVPVATAKRLVTSNVLTDAQLDHLLAIETRGTVWNAMLDATLFPGLERLTRMANAKTFTRATADKVVDKFNEGLSIEWLRLAAEKVAGRALVELWLRCPQEFTDEEISERLRVHSTWGPARPDKVRIVRLLSLRPGAISGAAHSDNPRIRTWAAGSRHLTDRQDQLAAGALEEAPQEASREYTDVHVFQMLALANNPVVPLDVVAMCHKHLVRCSEPDKAHSAQNRLERHPMVVTKSFETEDDPAKLAWLLKRSLPYDLGDGRWHDIKALLVNPNLHEGEVATIKGKLRGSGVHWSVVEEYNALVDRFPDLQDDWFKHQTLPPTVHEQAKRTEPEPLDDAHLDRIAGFRLSGLYTSTSAVRALDRELGDDEDAWAIAMATAESGFSGSVGELAMVALATAAA